MEAERARIADGAWNPFDFGLDGAVTALTVRSNKVFAGGAFTGALDSTGGTVATSPNIAQWTGTAWASVGGGFDGSVRALLRLPNNNVVAAGEFSTAFNVVGGSSVAVSGTQDVAMWTGAAWTALGAGIAGPCRALALHPSGDIVVTGTFAAAFDTLSTSIAANHIARFTFEDGPTPAHWSLLGEGLVPFIADPTGSIGAAVAVMHSGEIVAGGNFETAGDMAFASPFFARWSEKGVPWIAVQPPPGFRMGGNCGTVTIPFQIATGYDFAGPLTIHWFHNGTTQVVNGLHGTSGGLGGGGTVSGSSTEALAISGYTSADEGNYHATVTNSCGSVTTTDAITGTVCQAYFNSDCVLEVQDIFDFLTAWFDGCIQGTNNQLPSGCARTADFNLDLSLSVQDIFDFLSAWFGGCT